MTLVEIREAFEKFHLKEVLVIGDLMVDSYVWGKVERISPEAPVPVVNCSRKENRPGGAANVALNLKAMGAKPILCGIIGNDWGAELFKNIMIEAQLNTSGLFISAKRPTTVKTRVIGGNQQLIRIDEEITDILIPDEEEKYWQHIENIIDNHKFDAIIFQDYDKGALSPTIIERVANKAKLKQIITLVDPKKRNFFEYKNVTLFKPNFKEFCDGLKLEISKSDNIQLFETAKSFIDQHNIGLVMVTLSEKGIFICDKHTYHIIPAEIRDIADVSGAGDTVISVASLCMVSGFKPYFIAYVANMAGGLVCEKVGVVPVNKDQLMIELGIN